MASVKQQPNGRYRARYRDASGKEHARHFKLKREAQAWLDQESAKIQTGTWVAPKAAKLTVRGWCATWLEGYGTRKPSTVRQAGVHVAKINEQFGDRRMDSIRPSEVRNWLAGLQSQGYSKSYIYALHGRLSQILDDAVHDGVLARSPVSRRTSPAAARQRPYVATTEQVWALHDQMGERWGTAVLLAAFAGLRLGEVCGLRTTDVDFMRGIITPAVQYPAESLKTENSQWPVPIPNTMALALAADVRDHEGQWVLTTEWGEQANPAQLERRFRTARAHVKGLPEGFRFHDLRHYYASLLISSGLDVKVVQTRLRHASAKTTLDTYAHLWPDSDDTTRAAIEKVMAARVGTADNLRTVGS